MAGSMPPMDATFRKPPSRTSVTIIPISSRWASISTRVAFSFLLLFRNRWLPTLSTDTGSRRPSTAAKMSSVALFSKPETEGMAHSLNINSLSCSLFVWFVMYQLLQYFLSRLRYCIASATWVAPMTSFCSVSAMVRATRIILS